jgi:hypothetical protein
VTEHIEEEQLTVEDIISEAKDNPYTPVLNVWREILEASKEVRKERITPQWASRITSQYSGVYFDAMPVYRDLYYDKIDQLIEVLQTEIDSDDECLKHPSPEEDKEQNSFHYLNIIIGWQKTILSWELDWDCTHIDAAVELAAISEIHKMFFGETGLTSLLDQINFEFNESAQQLLFMELEEIKKNWTLDE